MTSWIYNYIIVGDSNVGKSSLCNRYIFDKFHYDNPQTIGIDFFTKSFMSRSNKKLETTIHSHTHSPNNYDKIKLHIWDSAGCESYKSITRSYFLNTCAVILVFDVCNRTSFINLISYWIPLIKAECSCDIDFVIVGNKSSDIHRNIKYDEGRRLALEHNTLYFETECKNTLTETNILNVFNYLTMKVNAKVKNSEKTPKGIKKLNYDIINDTKNLIHIEDIEPEIIKSKKCCFL